MLFGIYLSYAATSIKAAVIIQSVETSNRKVDNSEIQFPFEDEDGGIVLTAEAVESNQEEIHDIDQILTEVIETNTMSDNDTEEGIYDELEETLNKQTGKQEVHAFSASRIASQYLVVLETFLYRAWNV